VNPLTGGVETGETAVTLGQVDLVSSTKLRALVRKLEIMRTEDPQCKALVFSQFTSFLGAFPTEMSECALLTSDLIEPTLTKAGIKWLYVDSPHNGLRADHQALRWVDESSSESSDDRRIRKEVQGAGHPSDIFESWRCGVEFVSDTASPLGQY